MKIFDEQLEEKPCLELLFLGVANILLDGRIVKVAGELLVRSLDIRFGLPDQGISISGEQVKIKEMEIPMGSLTHKWT